MKILHIVGARPQFIKAYALSAAIVEWNRKGKKIQEVLVHTGQHYDRALSAIFFGAGKLRRPDYHLKTPHVAPSAQMVHMVAQLAHTLHKQRPDWVIVYGDTTTTAAGALAARQQNLKLAHVEAGCRSFDLSMREEQNRRLADHLADVLFCPSDWEARQLRREKVSGRVVVSGDLLQEAFWRVGPRLPQPAPLLRRWGLAQGEYYLVTLHRAETTDQPRRLKAAYRAIARLDRPVLWPLHPRTAQRLAQLRLPRDRSIRQIRPVAYAQMLTLERAARAVLTDSGGVQREAHYWSVPCLILRDRTEWRQLLNGRTRLVGLDHKRIQRALRRIPRAPSRQAAQRRVQVGQRIIRELIKI